MAGKVGDEDAEVLIREFLSVKGHDFLVGGEAVKEDDRAERRVGTRFVHVGRHLAATGGGEHGVNLVRLMMREDVTESAEQQTNNSLQQRAAVHRTS